MRQNSLKMKLEGLEVQENPDIIKSLEDLNLTKISNSSLRRLRKRAGLNV